MNSKAQLEKLITRVKRIEKQQPRRAVTAWQREGGYEVGGDILTPDQLKKLKANPRVKVLTVTEEPTPAGGKTITIEGL